MEKKPTFYWIRSNVKEKDNVAIGESPLEKNYRCVSHAIYFSSVSPIYWRPRWITWHLLSAISLLRVRKNIPLFFLLLWLLLFPHLTFLASRRWRIRPSSFMSSHLSPRPVFFLFLWSDKDFSFPLPFKDMFIRSCIHREGFEWGDSFRSQKIELVSPAFFSVDVRVGAAVVVGREKFSVKMSDHKKREKI